MTSVYYRLPCEYNCWLYTILMTYFKWQTVYNFNVVFQTTDCIQCYNDVFQTTFKRVFSTVT